MSRLGRSKCCRLGAASARSGRADEDNVPGGAPLHRRDDAARGGEGAKCVSPPRRLEIFEGHFLGGAPNALARIVNKDSDRSEVRLDGFEGPLHRCRVARIARIGARQGELLRQSAREAGRAGQQRDGISLRREPAGERGSIAGTDADDSIKGEDGKVTEWKSKALCAYQRRTKQAEALIAGAYLSGTNTRRVRRALSAVFKGAVGKDVVSRTWRKVKGDWDAWNARSLKDEPIVRLILDGTVVRARLDKKATSISLLVALGVREDGQKVLLAVKNMGSESEAAWRALLDDLVKRGLKTPATSSSPSRASRKANGNRSARRMRSCDCMKSSSDITIDGEIAPMQARPKIAMGEALQIERELFDERPVDRIQARPFQQTV
jgi:Transposase, Mutator family